MQFRYSESDRNFGHHTIGPLWSRIISILSLAFVLFTFDRAASTAVHIQRLNAPGEPSTVVLQNGQQQKSDGKLREQIKKLSAALNKRDLETIRSQISPSRIYVEIADKAGAYLSSNQTIMVMESFFRTRSAVSSTFEFVNDDGASGTASGTLTARKDGRNYTYRLNFGFAKAGSGNWLLTRISMR